MAKKCRKARKITRILDGAVPTHLELLELRQLLSATWTVNGTPGDDVILVSFDEPTSQISVSLNGTTSMRPAAKVKKLVINGGKGDDTITVDLGSQVLACVINGGAGTDTITCPDSGAVVHGNAGDDVINGGAGTDTLYGDAGNDTINGGAGNDKIRGGAGDDTLNGGDGDDAIYGDAGNDTLDGGAGNDKIDGGAGNDTLTGGAGDDKLYGGAGDDVLNGQGDADTYNDKSGHNAINTDQYDYMYASRFNKTTTVQTVSESSDTPPANTGSGGGGSGTTTSAGGASGSELNLTGGTLRLTALSSGVSGGITDSTTNIMRINNGVFSGSGVLTLDGVCSSGSTTISGGVLNINGGTLTALPGMAISNNTNAYTGVYIWNYGLVFSSNANQNVTIPTTLMPPTSNGITFDSGSITSGGSGYTAIPAVGFSGGGGQGATAVALVNNGVVAGIVITNPGYGYTSTPTVTIVAGGTDSGSGAQVTLSTTSGLIPVQMINSVTIPVPSSLSSKVYTTPSMVAIYPASGNGAMGDGYGATASMNLDASGHITSITVTNPGVGYTSTSPSINTLSNGQTNTSLGTLTLNDSATVSNSGSGVLVINGGSQTLVTGPIITGATLQSPTLTSGQLVV
jgi:hypothetical protein